MQKVLITGSNGLLGQKLVYELCRLNSIREEFEIIATARGTNRLLNQSGYLFSTMDISSLSDVDSVLARYRPDVVMHTAAMTNVDECELEPEKCFANNVMAVKNLVSVLEDLKEKNKNYDPHFIHLSTDFVFDGKSGPYTEEDLPSPISIYGQSKLDAENIVQESKLKWCIIRTIIVYGLVDNMSRSNLVLWAINALKKGQAINVVNDQFRSPTLAEDLATGCILAMRKNAQGIYNISGIGVHSIVELVQMVAREFGLDESLIQPISSEKLNQPAKRPPKTGFILDKAIRDLGYQPKTFEQGLKDFKSQLEKQTMIEKGS